uniref:Uncharacterized protein n=1 Tax=Panagrolaimus sp. JU765 TaxID=591449 RepID=A0AC34PV77_9BILA
MIFDHKNISASPGKLFRYAGKTILMKMFDFSPSVQCEWQAFQAIIFNRSEPIPKKIQLSEIYGKDNVISLTFDGDYLEQVFENDVKVPILIKFYEYISDINCSG